VPESFTLLWTESRCRWLDAAGEIGKPIEVIFGGPHQSAPSLSRFKAVPGDDVYVLRVRQKVMYIVARLRVSAILPIEDYLRDRLGLSTTLLSLPLWDLEEKLWAERPELGHRLPSGCISEAAIGEGSPLRLDCDVPSDVLERISFRSQRGERALKQVKDGKLMNTAGVACGVYRLAAESAADFASIIDRASSRLQPRRESNGARVK
jgi:hypothetical protein